jgi:hypothetical protein
LETVREAPEPTGPRRSFHPARLAGLLEELRPCVQARKPKLCEPILEQIQEMDLAEPFEEEVRRLVGQIKGYRYKEVAATLDALAERLQSLGGEPRE